MSLGDQDIQDLVDTVFIRFDKDGSGDLDQKEVHAFMTEVMKDSNCGKPVPQHQVRLFIREFDTSGDKRLQKP